MLQHLDCTKTARIKFYANLVQGLFKFICNLCKFSPGFMQIFMQFMQIYPVENLKSDYKQ